METLVVAAQHRNQYYTRIKSLSNCSNRFGYSPSRGFREINCRTFQSEAGILPTPFKSYSSPTTIKPSSALQISPSSSLHLKGEENLKNSGISSPISINAKATNKDESYNDDLTYSELWAGPAYSNSPPPSSLPIPKFSLRQKRSMSLDIPASPPEMRRHTMAKSAPPSPTRDPIPSPSNFFLSTDSATKNLRRILHLDIDE